MSQKADYSINGGVQGVTGSDFQKHFTLYYLFDNYSFLSNEIFFISMEHFEDIVYGFSDKNGQLKKIITFQAKKSSNQWTLSNLIEILYKITEVGESIENDTISKSKTFFQSNHFTTNNNIMLSTGKGKSNVKISEQNNQVQFKDLPKPIQDRIKSGNGTIKFGPNNIKHLDNLILSHVDLPKTSKSQLEQLYGKSQDVFGNTIADHKASVQALLLLLKKSETEFNQGGKLSLSDQSKRIESDVIKDALNQITARSKAYDFFRNKNEGLCEDLNITLFEKADFKFHYENSFDLFKDLKETEHLKIDNFVLTNFKNLSKMKNEIECINYLINTFKEKENSVLSEIQLKAVITASFIQEYYKQDNYYEN